MRSNDICVFPQDQPSGSKMIRRGGMSLRDYFAGMILHASSHLYDPKVAAARAYKYADAMLKERNRDRAES
jgi:hypothetical protein